jgi:site-specific recombinase XerC
VADLNGDVIAAYARHLETAGGRGGRPAALATRRIYLSMVRALARELGREETAAGVKVPRHKDGPPETITDADYQNLLRVPDRRSQIGKRDFALLRVLADCGLRSAELRGLVARDLRRPRTNARHMRLYVRGKGGTEREVPVPAEHRRPAVVLAGPAGRRRLGADPRDGPNVGDARFDHQHRAG